jgi:hypothetical protein
MPNAKLSQKPQPQVYFKEIKQQDKKEPDNMFFVVAIFLVFLFSYLFFANFYFI